MKRVIIKDVGKVITGNTPSKNNTEFYDSDDIGFIKPDGLGATGITLVNEAREYISENARKKARIVEKGTVLVTCIGNIGKMGIVENKEITFNQQINAIIPNKLVLSKYLAYNILSNRKRLEAIANAPVVPIINKTQFENFEILIHEEINEQARIVSILDNLTNIIDNKKKQLEEYDHLIKSRFVDMFGFIDKTKFDISKLEDLCEFITDGTHQTPTYTEDKKNGFKFLSSKDVTSGKIDWTKIKYIPADLHEQLYKRVSPQRNDILLAKNGTTGVAAIVDNDEVFDIYVSLAILRFKEGNNPYFLLYAINSVDTKRQFDSSLKGVGVPNLHLGEIRKTRIVLPPIELQNQYADFVQQVDKLKVGVQKSLDQTKVLFDSLMQEYFD